MLNVLFVLLLGAINPLFAEEQGAEPKQVVEQLPNYEQSMVKMLLTLLGLIVLIFLTFWAIRRMAKGQLTRLNKDQTIKILERRSLSPKSVLYMVQVGNKKILVAESQIEVRHLTAIEELPTLDSQ